MSDHDYHIDEYPLDTTAHVARQAVLHPLSYLLP